MIENATTELLRQIAAGVAVIVSPFVLALVWKASSTVSGIQAEVHRVNQTLVDFSGRITRAIEDHEDRIRPLEAKISVMWDGHERRRQPPKPDDS